LSPPAVLSGIAVALRHPLALSALAAGFTGWFGPTVARTWQNHDRALAIQAALVQDMSLSSSELVNRVQAYEFRPARSRAAYIAAFPKWDTESQVIGAKIRTYFSDSALASDWRDFCESMLDYYNLADLPGKQDSTLRARTLARLSTYVGRPKPDPDPLDRPPTKGSSPMTHYEYQLAWRQLKYRLLDKRDAIQRRVVKADVEL
jgi:hypothetical protein